MANLYAVINSDSRKTRAAACGNREMTTRVYDIHHNGKDEPTVTVEQFGCRVWVRVHHKDVEVTGPNGRDISLQNEEE